MSRPSTSLVRSLLARPASGVRPNQTVLRPFSTSSITRDEPLKVPVALISKIRSARPGTPLTLARSALAASKNDVPAALEWIAKQTAESGAKKAEKLAGRQAQEGVVAVAVLADGTGGVGVRASLVEMRCETDFVARTNEFRELAEGIARSLAFFAEPTEEGGFVKHDVKADALLHTPVVPAPHKVDPAATAVDSPPETVKTSLAQIVSRLGENIHLSRASSISINPSAPASATFLASSYLHASKTPSEAAATGVQSGALGGLLIARLAEGGNADKAEVKGLLRALARQVVAIPTTSVRAAATSASVESGEPSTALYEQSLITLAPSSNFEFEAGSKVGDVLKRWSEVRGVQGQGLEVMDLARWELGVAEEGETA